MKIKSIILIIMLTAFSMCDLFNLTIITTNNNIDILEQSKQLKIDISQDELHDLSLTEESISCIDSEKVITGITETFHFISSTNVDSVSSTGDISLLNFEIKGNEIICTLSNFPSDESVTLEFYNKNNLIDYVTLYFTNSDFGAFYSSSISLDTAKRSAGKTLNYELSYDEDEVFNYDSEVSLMGIGVTGSVSGTFRWTDDQGNIHPLTDAKVKITIDGSLWSATTYTNQSGFYSFSYNDIWHIGTGNPKITLYADNGETVFVSNGGTYSKSMEIVGSSGTFSYTFSPIADGDMGKAMIIFQAATSFADYAEAQNNGKAITKCCFNYPGDPSQGCYYNNNMVTITGRNRVGSSYPNSYSSWDVIGHEYGHHVQKCFDITANPGGTHSIPSNNIDDQYNVKIEDGITRKYTLEQSKDRGLKLAWGEGWATYWSTIAQSTFPDDLKTIPTVGDVAYTSYNGVEYELDRYSDISYGDADELVIQRILYKLCSSTTDINDKFAISPNELWDIIIENKPHTFYEFINDLYDDGYNKNDLGILLAEYNIAVSDLGIKNNYLDECPIFSWSTYMGSSNLNYDSFDLVFVNLEGHEILRKDNLSAIDGTGEYALTKSEWSNIISVYGRTYYAYIVARQNLSFVSGNYYSELFKFTEPDDFNRKVQIKPNEWKFEPQYFYESNKDGHTSTVIEDHGLTITTKRLRCGYIENSYVVLSPKRQNAGIAYLEMIFDKPVYSYMFGIALWSNNEGVNNSNSTAVVEVMDKYGNWTVDWDLFRDLPNGFSVRTQQIDRYETICKEGIYGIRFVMTSPATGDKNKGRLCIDDIVLNTDPNDLWFISSMYE